MSPRPAAGASKQRRMLEVLEQFRIVFKSVRGHYQKVERRAGISGAQLWALAQVAGNPGIQVGDLARALAIHQSTASNLLRRLERLGLITRNRDGKDQRRVQLAMTSKGLRVLRGAPRPLIGVLQQALSDLPKDNLDKLHRQLAKLIAAMQVKDLQARSVLLSEM
jgi:MarR family transcriptional regulator, organic hydroperoxide resistance regulator